MNGAIPQLAFSEPRQLSLQLAISLIDGFTGATELVGATSLTLSPRPYTPFQKAPRSIFLFFILKPGAYTIAVRNPYYLPADINVNLPMLHSLWPAFPDETLADQTKPLNDPAQAPAYLAQRAAATMQPSTAYPFPDGATLLRGIVRSGGVPLSNAQVGVVGSDPKYPTAADGHYVLFFPRIAGTSKSVTVQATHPSHASVNQAVTLKRAMTVSASFEMA